MEIAVCVNSDSNVVIPVHQSSGMVRLASMICLAGRNARGCGLGMDNIVRTILSMVWARDLVLPAWRRPGQDVMSRENSLSTWI